VSHSNLRLEARKESGKDRPLLYFVFQEFHHEIRFKDEPATAQEVAGTGVGARVCTYFFVCVFFCACARSVCVFLCVWVCECECVRFLECVLKACKKRQDRLFLHAYGKVYACKNGQAMSAMHDIPAGG